MRRLCNAKKKIPASIIATIVLLSSLLVPPASAASSWSKPRPSNDTDYFETIGNAYTNGIASVGMGVQIWDYNERAAGYLDELNLRVSVSANTRVGIGYNINPCSYAWFSVSNSTNITLDNSGVWLDLPFEVALFHGVYYNRVWVCDNGFLSFDSNSTSNTPQAIPNTDKPNSLIAPFWRDLDPDPSKGGSITYGTIGSPGDDSFVISWNGVPNKVNGTAKQSFQIIIFRIGSFSQPYSQHNRIYFQYKSITKDCPTVVGVEDIVGDRGSSYNYNQLASNSGLEVRYPVSGYRIERLRIRLLKSDTAATINVQRPQIGGYNVILKQPPSDTYGDFFVDAVGFGAEHLLGRYVGIPGAGVVFGVWLIVFENAIRLASALSEPIFGVKDAGTSENEANVTSEASSEAPVPGCCKPFDATLSALITWYFNDANDRGHSLKIIAELEYLELLDDYVANYYTISTSVSLNM